MQCRNTMVKFNKKFRKAKVRERLGFALPFCDLRGLFIKELADFLQPAKQQTFKHYASERHTGHLYYNVTSSVNLLLTRSLPMYEI